MSKSHITARVDETLMKKVNVLLKKYPGLKLAKILEVSLDTFFRLDLGHQEEIIARYLLKGLREPTSKDKE